MTTKDIKNHLIEVLRTAECGKFKYEDVATYIIELFKDINIKETINV